MFDVGQCATRSHVRRIPAPRRRSPTPRVQTRRPVQPADFTHIGHRTMPEPLQAELLLIFGLGEMCMQAHSVLARQICGFTHQLASDAEWRARSEDDAHPSTRVRIVVPLDEPLRVLQDGIFRIDHRVRRQAALRLTQAHGAARGVQTNAQFAGRVDLVIQPRAVRKEI